MQIYRDFLEKINLKSCLEAILIRGPRQIGKSTLLRLLEPKVESEIYFDDVSLKEQAIRNPDFFLESYKKPILIDEVHLVPKIFFTIKKEIDQARRERFEKNKKALYAEYRLTGSNQNLLDETVKESLAGRISQFYLLGLSVNEIINFNSEIKLSEIFFRGGFPELWVRPELNVVHYLNDYISSFIEKDIARLSGVEKMNDFLKVLKMIAARTGNLLNSENISSDLEVVSKTVNEWIDLLEKNQIVYRLPVYSTNLNKRLTRVPKIYFLDLGLCVRLQGHQQADHLIHSTLGGALFETLVISEAIKTKLNFKKEWEFFLWRTKENEEIDLIIETIDYICLIEVKVTYGSNSSTLPKVPAALLEKNKKIHKAVVVATSSQRKTTEHGWEIVPITLFKKYLIDELDL